MRMLLNDYVMPAKFFPEIISQMIQISRNLEIKDPKNVSAVRYKVIPSQEHY